MSEWRIASRHLTYRDTSTLSNTRQWNGSIGSITAGCSSQTGMSHRRSWKRRIIINRTSQPWGLTYITEPPENPGPFRLSFGFNRELACATYLILTLPNFIIIGAGRSGTTSHYNYLGQRPDVFMSPVKKTGFFAWRGEPPDYTKGMVDLARAYSIRTLDEYTALFADAGAAKAIGEATQRLDTCSYRIPPLVFLLFCPMRDWSLCCAIPSKEPSQAISAFGEPGAKPARSRQL